MTPHNIKANDWPYDQEVFLRLSTNNPGKEGIHLAEIRKIAEDEGGKLLSKEWLGATVLHNFAFENGTPFKMTPMNIKKNLWPKDQELFFKLSINNSDFGAINLAEMSDIAAEREGKLLDNKWLGANNKYNFAFKDGTTFTMLPGNLRANRFPKNQDIYIKRLETLGLKTTKDEFKAAVEIQSNEKSEDDYISPR